MALVGGRGGGGERVKKWHGYFVRERWVRTRRDRHEWRRRKEGPSEGRPTPGKKAERECGRGRRAAGQGGIHGWRWRKEKPLQEGRLTSGGRTQEEGEAKVGGEGHSGAGGIFEKRRRKRKIRVSEKLISQISDG